MTALRAGIGGALCALGVLVAIGCSSNGSSNDDGGSDVGTDMSVGGSSGGTSSGASSSGSSGGSGSSGSSGASGSSGGSAVDATVDGTGVTDAGSGDADAAFAPETSVGADASDASHATSLCDGGKHTTISGRVYDPANVNPVYRAAVYVPSGSLANLPTVPSCGACDDLYSSPVAATLTDPAGNFVLVDPPAGTDTLVVQIGKWRMAYPSIAVTACQDNPQADHTLRLPKNHTEGDLPQIAFVTGAADSLECVPLRMGVNGSEYVAGAGSAGGGHIHIFTGAGGVGGAALQGGTSYDPSANLWDKQSDITPYDVVVLSCEGTEPAGVSTTTQTVLWNYTQAGGRILASHFHYAWFNTGPFSTMVSPALATWTTGANIDNDPIYGVPATSFPEGQGFTGWLADAGALTGGKLPVHFGRDNAVVGAANTLSQVWLTADNTSLVPGNAQLFSFDTPLEAGAPACGRVVYTDIHAAGGPNNSSDPNTDYPGFSPGIVPSGCTAHPLTAQEKVIEYQLFGLSSCLTPIGQTPVAPRVP